jgi:hypothetical protein
MISHSLSSTRSHSPQRVLIVGLAVVILAAVLAGPVVSVASAQAANGTNGTNTSASTNTTISTPANVSGGTAGNATPNASQPATATNRTNGTNAPTASAPGGNTSRLSPSGGTAAANQTALTKWVNELAQMNASQAKQAVENNPQKKQKLVNALQQLGVQNPQQKVQQQPRQVARRVAGVLSTGQTQTNATNATNASAGSGQVKLQKCSGGFIESTICKASNFLFGWVIGGVVSFVQGVITGIVNMIFGFSIPKVDGHVALFQKPANQPWTGLYESWKTEAMPMGFLIWVLMLAGILFTQVFTSDPSTALKLRELRSRAWKVLFGILGSWAIGAAILFVVNSLILTIAPNGSDIASNFAVFGGSVGAAGAAGLLVWFFEGVLFLFIVLLLLAQKAMVFIMMWSLPVLIPLAAIDVGPVKYISKPARGIIDMFIPFIFMTLPMALVLRVGYEVVNALNQGIVAQLGMWASQSNTALILGFWIAAAVSPLFVFSQTGRIKGMAAGLLGASVATNSGGLKEKVENAKERVDRNPPPNVSETTDINPDENEGTWGGTLPSGIDRPSMLEAGTQDLAKRANEESSVLAGPGGDSQSPAAWAADSTAPETGEAGDPELPPGQPLSGGDGSNANVSSGATSTNSRQTASTGSNPVVSRGEVTQVNHPSDLPSETKYSVGHVKDNGEFQPVRNASGLDRTALLNGTYNRLNTGTQKYQDENLLIQSSDDGSFYDMDSMTYREQSYEQMSRDTSKDVLNS